MNQKDDPSVSVSLKFVSGVTTGILITVLVLKFSGYFSAKPATSKSLIPSLRQLISKPTPTPDSQALAQTSDVLPADYKLGVSFGDVVVKMVQQGAIDKNKFLQLYSQRDALTDKQKQLLETPSSDELVITQENAGLLLNLLWPLGISNNSKVLSEGPMGTQYKGKEGDFASTGGWTLGSKGGGKLFNSMSLISFSPEQETLIMEIASNIYRPCCGNSTAFPDCNHGAAMLGFIELAVAQGMPKEEIYQKALVLNSYWFPQTYAELATYFKTKKNISWKNVDAKEILGVRYSSGQGYAEINKQLQSEGLLPKVQGGGGCGV